MTFCPTDATVGDRTARSIGVVESVSIRGVSLYPIIIVDDDNNNNNDGNNNDDTGNANDVDDDNPTAKPSNVLNEITTKDLPNTGGFSFVTRGTALMVVFGVALLALRLVAARRESR